MAPAPRATRTKCEVCDGATNPASTDVPMEAHGRSVAGTRPAGTVWAREGTPHLTGPASSRLGIRKSRAAKAFAAEPPPLD